MLVIQSWIDDGYPHLDVEVDVDDKNEERQQKIVAGGPLRDDLPRGPDGIQIAWCALQKQIADCSRNRRNPVVDMKPGYVTRARNGEVRSGVSGNRKSNGQKSQRDQQGNQYAASQLGLGRRSGDFGKPFFG